MTASTLALPGLAGILASGEAPVIMAATARVRWPSGASRSATSSTGAPSSGAARSDRRDCRVEWSLDESFAGARDAVRGPHALEASDYTARVDLTGLPAEPTSSCASVRGPGLGRARSEPLLGRFSHAAGEAP